MEDLVEGPANGNVTEVKVVLASVVVALAVYQVFLMAVGYGKLRLPFLNASPASSTHRTVGDTIVVITLLVAFMCVAYFGFKRRHRGRLLRRRDSCGPPHRVRVSLDCGAVAQDRPRSLVAPVESLSARARPYRLCAFCPNVAHFGRRLPRGVVRCPTTLQIGGSPRTLGQMIGSLVAAVLIVIVVIALVTANLGPGDSGRHGGDETRNEEDNSGPGSS